MRTWLSPAQFFYKRVVLITILCLSTLLLQPCKIQAQELGKRPLIGLVLSGGGACGLAHIGLLKVMEEAGLRPDYITGVSMGSIIGGLYSIGYSADSLEKIVKVINWDKLFSNKIPEDKIIQTREDKIIREIKITEAIT